MQKRIWGWLVLAVSGLIVGLSGFTAAHADYTIKPYHMRVNVSKRGDATVTQTMTYAFDDDYHGVFNVQDTKGIQGAKILGVTTALNNQVPVTARAATTGADNTYQVTRPTNRLKTKLYRSVTDGDKLKVTYRLKLTGVVTNYRDTAELNWKVIGSGWSVPLDNVRVTIQLPATHIKQLQAWTHGPLDGHTRVDKAKGRIVMTVGENPEESFVESHLLFPATVTPNARRIDQPRKAAAQKLEAKLVAEANAKRQRQHRWLVGGLAGLWALAAAVAGSLWFWARRHPGNHYPHPIPIPHFFDVPRVAPAVAESLDSYASPDTDALAGEILMAATHKELTLEPMKDGRHQTMLLTKVGPVTNSFLDHCFDRVARDGASFTLRDLKAFGKRDKKGRLGKWFQQWQDEVNETVEAYQDGDNLNLRSTWLLFGWSLAVILAVAGALGWFLSQPIGQLSSGVALVGILVTWVLVSRARRRLDRYNAEGLVLANEVGGFRRMLKDIGHFNTAKIGDLILWEEILPYAAAFGLSKQVTEKLAVDFDQRALQTAFVGFYPWYFAGGDWGASFSDSLNDGLSGALQASNNSSSSSGSSGGFSGGSSGGFGGGSGGGAF